MNNAPAPIDAGTKGQVLELLGKGISPAIVAATLNISPSYISQLKEDQVFSGQLQEMLVEKSLASTLRDEALDALEDKLIEKASEAVAFITKPMEAIRALKDINSMQRRSIGEVSAPQENVTTVVVSLPMYLQQEIHVQTQVSSSNEVVEVDGRAMVTMPAAAVLEKVKNRAAASVGSAAPVPSNKALTKGEEISHGSLEYQG